MGCETGVDGYVVGRGRWAAQQEVEVRSCASLCMYACGAWQACNAVSGALRNLVSWLHSVVA